MPFVFVYGPAMLIVTPEFTWFAFLTTTFGCIAGIVLLSMAFGGFGLALLRPWERIVLGLAALPTIAPGLPSTLAGLAVASPILIRQVIAWRGAKPATAA